MAYEIDTAPVPDHASTPEEFMVRLRQLKEWAGFTYRELEIRARDSGDHLARSTLASTLRRGTLPRQDFVEALVRSCGVDPGPWVAARRRLTVLDAAADKPAPPRMDERPPQQLPPVPSRLVGRGRELERAVRMITGAPVTVISGPPGGGKSAMGILAAQLAAHRFPDGQLYVNLRGTTPGAEPMPPAEIAGALLRGLGCAAEKIPVDAGEAAARLRSTLRGRRVLILLDDVVSAAQVRPLVPIGGPSSVVLTSRTSLTSLDGSHHLHVGALSPEQAAEVLEWHLGPERVEAEPDAVRMLAHLCGHVPLALRVAAARLNARPGWPVRALTLRMADERNRLDEFRVDDLEVRASLALSFGDLEAGGSERDRLAARALRLLADLPEGEVRLSDAVEVLEVSTKTADRVLERLVDAGLLESPGPGRYRVPGLIRLFALDPNRPVQRLAMPDGPEGSLASGTAGFSRL